MRPENLIVDKLLEDGLIEEHDGLLLEKETYGPNGLDIKGKTNLISFFLLLFRKTQQNQEYGKYRKCSDRRCLAKNGQSFYNVDIGCTERITCWRHWDSKLKRNLTGSTEIWKNEKTYFIILEQVFHSISIYK